MKTLNPCSHFVTAALGVAALSTAFTPLTPVLASAPAPFASELLAQEARITNATPTDYDGFGNAVAVSGDTAAISGEGEVKIYDRTGGAWNWQATLSPPASGEYGDFGGAVALENDTLAAGVASGPSVLVFKRSDQPARNAWNTSDQTSTLGVFYQYHRDFTGAEQQSAATEGWTLSIRARMVDDFGGTKSCFVDFADANGMRFLLFFALDSNHDLVVSPEGLSPINLTTNGLGWAAYHLYEITFDPTTATADFYVDHVKMNASPWSPTPVSGLNGVRFGNGSSAGTGAMNWNLVQFKTSQSDQVLASYDAGTAADTDVAPDPETQGWVFFPGNAGSGASKGPVSPDGLSAWPVQAVLEAPGASSSASFGARLALDGDTMVIGGGGAAFVSMRNGSNWSEPFELIPSVLASGDSAGDSVAVDGDTIVVGVGHYPLTVQNPFPGRAFVFHRTGTNWTEVALLEASDKAAADQFGNAVAISGQQIAIGAEWDDHAPSDYAGSVYVFENDGSGWVEQSKFFAPVTSSGDEGFGDTVAMSGDTIVVGSFYRHSHWLYQRVGTDWVLTDTKVYPDTADPAVHDVDFDGQTIIVGVSGTEGETGAGYIYRPDYSDAAKVAQYVREFLYYGDAGASLLLDKDHAAFRYKDLLYGEDTRGVRAHFAMMSDFYGPPERDRVDVARQELMKGLAFHPNDAGLGNLALDIYYDRTVAETILAKNLEQEATLARFGPPLAPPAPTGGFIIDNEIPLYRQLLETNRYALKGFLAVLSDDLGVPGDPALGYQLFQTLVPNRALMAATYTNSMGQNVPVTTNTMLFSGYKDLVLVFDLLRNYGRTADSLVRLLVGRNTQADLAEARDVVAAAEKFLFLQGTLLKNIFTDLPPEGDPSGLAETIAGWRESLNRLGTLRELISGKSNLLGFAPDFLMLVENFQDPQNPAFDSFDSFKALLSLSSADSRLSIAKERLDDARTSYDKFEGYEDDLHQQFDNAVGTYEDRLFEIVGARPGQPNYSDVATNNPGSELDQQTRSIEAARLKILRNQTEMDNLSKEVQIEIQRAMAVSNAVTRYGNMQADLTKQIGHIKAAQAAANALASAFNPEQWVAGLVVGVLNGAAQAASEEGIAGLEAQKEQLAGQEQAEVEGINSAAHIKTLLLGMRTLAVDSLEAALVLRQEVARLAGLYREKSDLEARIAENNINLTSRYFADPVHRQAAEAGQIRANLAFAEAQRWLFFMVRALEYKWNTPFANFVDDGRTWSLQSIFKVRNADELEDFYLAMRDFDLTINRGKTYRFDWFSVREDFMGLHETNSAGQIAMYSDPQTGLELDAIAMFRTNLLRSMELFQGGAQVVLNFNTVRQIPGGFFFLGPTFDLDGKVLNKGRFLDKIDYLQIRLPGHHTLGHSQLPGNLTYGGTSFIRNFNVGHFAPGRPDHLAGEMTAYSTRYWFYDVSTNQMRWRFNEALTIDGVEMELTPDPRIPPTVTAIEEFKERSVAATGWKLAIPIIQQNVPVLNVDQLDDVEIYFHHYSAQRQ